jgi:hypothetical protein
MNDILSVKRLRVKPLLIIPVAAFCFCAGGCSGAAPVQDNLYRGMKARERILTPAPRQGGFEEPSAMK